MQIHFVKLCSRTIHLCWKKNPGFVKITTKVYINLETKGLVKLILRMVFVINGFWKKQQQQQQRKLSSFANFTDKKGKLK